jgi:hypothetical protein
VKEVGWDGLEKKAREYGTYISTDDGLPPATGQTYHLRVGAFFDIQDGLVARVTNYYNITDFSLRQDFLDDNPVIRDALILQDYLITQVPGLDKYYGGFDTSERYLKSLMYRELEKTYGTQIRDMEEEYYDLPTNDERKEFLRQNPTLKKYIEDKKERVKEIDKKLLAFQKYLPQKPTLQEGIPQGQFQQALTEAIEQTYPIEYWVSEMGQPMVRHIREHLMEETDLSYYADRELDYAAERLGMSKQEILALMFRSFSGQ